MFDEAAANGLAGAALKGEGAIDCDCWFIDAKEFCCPFYQADGGEGAVYTCGACMFEVNILFGALASICCKIKMSTLGRDWRMQMDSSSLARHLEM